MSLRLASLLLVIPAAAAAEPASTRCYAGVETVELGKVEHKYDLVIERTLEPDKAMVSERSWSSKDPGKERAFTGKVDLKSNTFTFSDGDKDITGTAKLEGKPWKWTAQTLEIVRGGVKITTVSKLDGDKIHSTGSGQMAEKVVFTISAELTKFDCAKRDEKVKALAPPPAAPPAKP